MSRWIDYYVTGVDYARQLKKCPHCFYICQGFDGETGIEYQFCPECGENLRHGLHESQMIDELYFHRKDK